MAVMRVTSTSEQRRAAYTTRSIISEAADLLAIGRKHSTHPESPRISYHHAIELHEGLPS
jgi:hypothetical protein